MKKITSMLLLVVVFATMFSINAFAATDTNVFTITTDKEAYAANEEIVVTVTLTGDLQDVAVVNTSIKFDGTKVAIDDSEDRDKGMVCIEDSWFTDLDDNYKYNLGYITAEPTPGIEPAGQLNIAFISTKGYVIDNKSEIYTDNGSVVSAKFVATAVSEIEKIDSSYFELVNCYVAEENTTRHASSMVQIVSADPDPVPVDKYVEAEDVVTELEAAEGTYTNIAIFKAAFEGLQEKGATQIGYDLTKAKSAVNNGKVITTTIEGNGKVEFALAIYGITAEQVDELTFAPYYTVLEAPAAN